MTEREWRWIRRRAWMAEQVMRAKILAVEAVVMGGFMLFAWWCSRVMFA